MNRKYIFLFLVMALMVLVAGYAAYQWGMQQGMDMSSLSSESMAGNAKTTEDPSSWGIAEGDDCVTLSVGFRAPAEADILRDWTDHVADQLSDDRRSRDGALRAVDHSAYIPSDAVERVAGIIQSRMTSTDGLAQRFGQTMTAPLDPDEPLPPVVDETRFSQQRISATLVLRLGARLAFDDNYLFADGAACRYAPEARGLIEALCTLEAGDPVPDELDNALAFLLYSQGTLEFEDDADD